MDLRPETAPVEIDWLTVCGESKITSRLVPSEASRQKKRKLAGCGVAECCYIGDSAGVELSWCCERWLTIGIRVKHI